MLQATGLAPGARLKSVAVLVWVADRLWFL